MVRNKERRLEISSKLLQMGHSLVNEGQEVGDKNVAHTGTSLILLAGVMLNDEDTKTFSDIRSMFSAKKVMDAMMGGPSIEDLDKMKNTALEDILRRLADENDGKKESDDEE
jgi:CheY-specific phosphatase CheX